MISKGNEYMVTKYGEIVKVLENEILNGKYSDTKKLPTEDELIEILNVSKLTLRKAIDILVSKGYVYRVQGSGVFLRDFNKKGCMDVRELNGLTRTYSNNNLKSKIIEFKLINADEELAANLKCDINTKVYYIKRVRYLEGTPMEIEESYYNKDIIPYLNKEICEGSIFNYIINDLKLKIGFSDRVISCDKLNKEDAELLGLEENDPALILNNTVFLKNGRIFDVSVEKYNYNKMKIISFTSAD